MEDERKLIQEAQKGDKESFGKIYSYYYQKIYRYCSFNLKDNERAQDICQESFVKFWKKIRDFKMDGNWSLQAFLFAIARNLIIDESRKKKNVNIEDYENLQSKENLYDDIEKKENIKRVRNVLSKLDEIERQIVILRYFEELPSLEVAKILGIKDGALRVRTYRVMQKIKKIFEGLYGTRN